MNKAMINNIKSTFKSKFSTEPLMVFSPGRINIIGEHTDYNDGFVFPAAIDKGIVAAIQKSDAEISTAFAVDMNEGIEFFPDSIQPLHTEHWGNYVIGVVSEIQKKGIKIENFDVVFGGDIPGGAGLSSSAALENSIVVGLNETFNLGLSREEMIYISQKAEHNFAGVNCGIMDQYASMFGIENHALLLDCRSIEAKPFKIDFHDYELILINTNVKHSLSDSAYNDRRSVCESISKMLNIKALRDATESDLLTIKDQVSDEDYQKVLYVVQENQRAVDAGAAMLADDLEKLGELIFASHEGLSKQYKVSCDELDFLVDCAKESDQVIGARMMGGGFGGCTINLVSKTGSKLFQEAVTKAYKNKFNNDCSIYAVSLSNGTGLI
ncbi:galactokinase [Pseudalgibacter alginicilyticus]|uniref:Galactokinase n=1 Tax=Pseudalgibacter alginicilyticus TaxID=1736674 RepID=A0A0P0DAI7_9FLAO|nr:galactokinase [Pseudalgibacter alginicilyticus]ALJ05055.1 galactokinase [Pseudalgibacter alginicilyticus]